MVAIKTINIQINIALNDEKESSDFFVIQARKFPSVVSLSKEKYLIKVNCSLNVNVFIINPLSLVFFSMWIFFLFLFIG
ncbi:hypothetical protein TCT1_31620 [Xenorhabdus sp. TCT-1]|uniref:Uncharacterized protein n=1 Tax=Xenorhabdus taiwanensis TaxID=3085177 RepID=A0ABN7C747_9GAMM|nr:hypothetical protein TCT1_31620 [Xenorhabdus sp. TCT-1]